MSNFAPSTTYAPNAEPFGSYEYTAPEQNTDPFGQNALYGNGGNSDPFGQANVDPFGASQSTYDAAPTYQSGYQQTDQFAQYNFAPNAYSGSFDQSSPDSFGGFQASYDSNPFSASPDMAPQQNYGNMAPQQDKGERWRQAGKAVLDLGRKAVGAIIQLAPGNKTANRMQNAYNMADSMQGAMPQAQNAYNTVRQDASAAWANRGQYANQAANFVGNAAMETGKAGFAGAGEYAMNRYGLQRDREARFGITVANKRALARGIMRTAISPQAEAARLAHGAFNAGRREATLSARGQMAAARSNARGAAANYARGIF
jgi:hypothetical protein